ncbi:MAG TPA: hypothetical protein VFX59_05185 [Polyangiales bacterium]|nr:hypothetical protein [Polyangiales bacterium]
MKRSSVVVIALALVAVLAGAWYMFWPHTSLPVDPLAAVPADSYGVAHIRVDRVLASDAWKRLIVERGQAKGIERVQVLCGFNPLDRIKELTVFARPAPGGGLPKLAFAARGELNHQELLDCVKKFTGGDDSALTREDIEGIPTVQSKKGSSRAAFIGRDGIVGGDAESVAAVIHTVLQKAPSLSGDLMMKQLYAELEQGSDITLVSRLPEEAKPMIRQLATVAGPKVELLEEIKLFGVTVVTSSAKLAGGITLVTGSTAEANAFVELGKNAIGRLLTIPGIGMTPAYGVLKTVQSEVRGDRATFSGLIKVASVETLLELAPALEAFAGDMVPGAKPDASKPTPAPAPAPTIEQLQPEEPPTKKRKKD